ncbi:MAG TPA: methyltransferase [Pyrinomonadaceae bacterium]|nr:methyltransferase [Pyrinomonadaceae bacterium]
MRRRGGTWMQRWRVPLGFLSAILFFWLARPDARSLIAGGLIALVGVGIRAWASGHIRKNDALAISGPYAYTRNPLYLGSFVLGFGFSVASGNLWLWLLFAALFLGIYWPVMRVEAETLAGLFGTDYANYARAVPLFLPRLTPYRGGTAEKIKFDLQLYLRYREYRATVGLLLAWGVLALKAFLAR